MKKVLFFISLLLMPLLTLNADVCSDAKEDAKNLKFSYETKRDSDGFPYWRVTIKNMTKRVAIVGHDGDYYKDGKYDVYPSQIKTEVVIYVHDYNYTCDPVRTIKHTFPMYNIWANKNICEGIEDYKYCSEFLDEEIDSYDLEEKILNFRKNLEDKGMVEELTEEEINSNVSADAVVDPETVEKKKEEAKKENIKTTVLKVVPAGLALILLVLVVILFVRRKRMVVK